MASTKDLMTLQNLGKTASILFFACSLVLCFIWFTDSAITHMQESQQKSLAPLNEARGKVFDTREYKCVVQALYHEARGEGTDGLLAVASVIDNRVKSKRYPNSYCEVIHQPRQFSYVHERQAKGLSLEPKPQASEKEIYQQIQAIAKNVVLQEFEPVLDRDILWYAHSRVNNYWTKAKVKAAKIGQHIFYKKGT